MVPDSDEGDVEEIANDEGKKKVRRRRDIRKVLNAQELREETREAEKQEKERAKRIAEKQSIYNKLDKECKMSSESNTNPVVLEYDCDKKKPLVQVHPDLAEKMKAHQIDGIKFMYDNVIESVSKLEDDGTGCILAHSMGLGKTFQIIAFTHTLLSHPKINKHIKTILIIVPVNTIKNWIQEYVSWLEDNGLLGFPIFDLSDEKSPAGRAELLKEWQKKGGIMICGLTLFSQLLLPRGKKQSKSIRDKVNESLSEPGPDIVVIDEGHLLKNSKTNVSKAVSSIATLRRIILTGTPLQNNLEEYFVMVDFIKPNLLGTKKEFANRFVNPIANGQHIDSTPHDVHRMKKRVHILHKKLSGCVQRVDYNVLKPYLPPKHEYVLSIRLSDKQIELYRHYLTSFTESHRILVDYSNLRLVWNHPGLLYVAHLKREKAELRKAEKNLINDDSDESISNVSDIDEGNLNLGNADNVDLPRTTRSNASKNINNGNVNNNVEQDPEAEYKNCWFYNMLPFMEMDKIEYSTKMIIFFKILQLCEKIGDKVIVFSQSLDVLDFIETALEVESRSKSSNSNSTRAEWIANYDYFRIDGSTASTVRKSHIDKFNDPKNLRARLFLLSTKAGGLGINLVGANRCVIFDASWNPSHDVQAIYRIYRFGQVKPVYIYRFIAQGTMEEKIYERQIIKQSLSFRVVDELSVGRHFRAQEVAELYTFEPDTCKDRSLPNMPKDKLFADIINENLNLIVKYHEHDSLLENRPDESLSEAERLAAWKEYEDVSILSL